MPMPMPSADDMRRYYDALRPFIEEVRSLQQQMAANRIALQHLSDDIATAVQTRESLDTELSKLENRVKNIEDQLKSLEQILKEQQNKRDTLRLIEDKYQQLVSAMEMQPQPEPQPMFSIDQCRDLVDKIDVYVQRRALLQNASQALCRTSGSKEKSIASRFVALPTDNQVPKGMTSREEDIYLTALKKRLIATIGNDRNTLLRQQQEMIESKITLLTVTEQNSVLSSMIQKASFKFQKLKEESEIAKREYEKAELQNKDLADAVRLVQSRYMHVFLNLYNNRRNVELAKIHATLTELHLKKENLSVSDIESQLQKLDSMLDNLNTDVKNELEITFKEPASVEKVLSEVATPLVLLYQGEAVGLDSVQKPQEISSESQAAEFLRSRICNLMALVPQLESTPSSFQNPQTPDAEYFLQLENWAKDMLRKIIDTDLFKGLSTEPTPHKCFTATSDYMNHHSGSPLRDLRGTFAIAFPLVTPLVIEIYDTLSQLSQEAFPCVPSEVVPRYFNLRLMDGAALKSLEKIKLFQKELPSLEELIKRYLTQNKDEFYGSFLPNKRPARRVILEYILLAVGRYQAKKLTIEDFCKLGSRALAGRVASFFAVSGGISVIMNTLKHLDGIVPTEHHVLPQFEEPSTSLQDREDAQKYFEFSIPLNITVENFINILHSSAKYASEEQAENFLHILKENMITLRSSTHQYHDRLFRVQGRADARDEKMNGSDTTTTSPKK